MDYKYCTPLVLSDIYNNAVKVTTNCDRTQISFKFLLEVSILGSHVNPNKRLILYYQYKSNNIKLKSQ